MKLLEFLTITENSSGVTIQYRGQPKVAVKPRRAREDVLMTIPIQAMDAAFKRDGESFYVGPGGTGAAIGDRYAKFQRWIEENQEYEVPEVYVDERGIMSFTNGRHRYAVLRDAGVDPMPVAMSPEAVKNAQQLLKAELHEDDLYSDEVEPTYPNPLPSLSSDDPRFGELFDRADEAIYTVVEKLNFSARGIKGAQEAVIKRYAKIVDMPIANLTCTEVNLYEDHLQRLIRGEGKKELPLISKMGDVFLVNDGNHRIVAEHLKGNDTVRVKLLDIDAIEEEFGIISEGILDALPPGARKLATGLAMMAALSGAQGHESELEHPPRHPSVTLHSDWADRLGAMADIIGADNPDRYGQWVSNLYDVYQSNPLAFKRMFGAEYEVFLDKARHSTPQEMGAYMKAMAKSFRGGVTEAAPRKSRAKYSYWDLVEHYGLTKLAEWSRNSDEMLPWINNNRPGNVNKAVRDPERRLLSHIRFYFEHILNVSNFSRKVSTPETFEAALNTPIQLWRGGGGEYNPDYEYRRAWTSFTADERRVKTFSQYVGTSASPVFMLPERSKYWEVSLTIPLKDILLFIHAGMDEEVIVSTKDARNAKVVS